MKLRGAELGSTIPTLNITNAKIMSLIHFLLFLCCRILKGWKILGFETLKLIIEFGKKRNKIIGNVWYY